MSTDSRILVAVLAPAVLALGLWHVVSGIRLHRYIESVPDDELPPPLRATASAGVAEKFLDGTVSSRKSHSTGRPARH